ncbi:MAG: UDP-2,3-diacylglucosamine diphosphatase [Isosphaeraceae bacterium]
MPIYFASDMHLRLDRPARGRRLARWVDTLSPEDELYLLGDVCDFWFASRQIHEDPLSCAGLRALAAFRSRGGALTILPGNHDRWLGPFYERVLGAKFVQEPQRVTAHGKTLHLVHGHKCGARAPWKGAMESRAFLRVFRSLPAKAAHQLDELIDHSNVRSKKEDEARFVQVYRRQLASIHPQPDLALFGHVHTPLDDPLTSPRMIILGGWQERTCYLQVDEEGVKHVVEPALSFSTV